MAFAVLTTARLAEGTGSACGKAPAVLSHFLEGLIGEAYPLTVVSLPGGPSALTSAHALTAFACVDGSLYKPGNSVSVASSMAPTASLDVLAARIATLELLVGPLSGVPKDILKLQDSVDSLATLVASLQTSQDALGSSANSLAATAASHADLLAKVQMDLSYVRTSLSMFHSSVSVGVAALKEI